MNKHINFILDPFVIVLILTIILFITTPYFTHYHFNDVIYFWGNGFWNLMPFTMQMTIMLINGYVIATSNIIKNILYILTKNITNAKQAIIITTIASMIGCYLNWGLGLIFSSTLCVHLGNKIKNINFGLLVSSAYSGFLIWHGGLSGSIPLTIATKNSFSENLIGHTIPITKTLFSLHNIMILSGLLIILPLTNFILLLNTNKKQYNIKNTLTNNNHTNIHNKITNTKHSFNMILSISFFILCIYFIIIKIHKQEFSFDINNINFILIFIGLALHKNFTSFMQAIGNGSKKAGPILLHFPFYAAIMQIMISSQLAISISNTFLSYANLNTFYLLSFYSAGFINIFIPSGGGQWAIQAPIMIKAAKTLNADIPLTAMSIAWGDAWTNLLQPFWALPLLNMAGIQLKYIFKYCIIIFIISGLFLSAMFYFI